MSYQIAWEPSDMVVTVTETLAGRDLCGFVEKICEDARFDTPRYCIVDLSCVDRVILSSRTCSGTAVAFAAAGRLNYRTPPGPAN